MIPLTLKMRNFLSYRGETPLFDFRLLRIACISGENGAGKSSFLEAIHWALWGKARIDDNSELISRGEASMMVELVFEVNTIVYRVTRSYSSEKQRGGTKLDLAQAIDDAHLTWSNLNGGTVSETQLKIIHDIVGMSYEIFQNSAYLRQGKADAFVQLTSGARRDVIAEILEITRYDAYQQEAKRRRDELTAGVETLKGKIAEDEQTASEIPDHIALVNTYEDRAKLAQSFKLYADAVEAHQQHQHTIKELTQKLAETNTRLDEQQRELNTYTEKLALRPQIEATYAQYQGVQQHIQTLEQRQQQLKPLLAQQAHAHTKLKDAQTAAEIQIAGLKATLDSYDSLLIHQNDLNAELTKITNILASTADASTTLQQTTAQRDQHQQKLQILLNTQQTLTQDRAEQLRVQQRIDELTTELHHYAEAVAHVEAATQAHARIAELDRIIADCNARDAARTEELATLTQNAEKLKLRRNTILAGEPCPTCQTVMDEAHLSHAYATFDQQIEEWRVAYREAQTQQKTLRQQKAAAENEKLHHQPHVKNLRAYQQRLARLDEQQLQLADATTRMTHIQDRIHAIDAQQLMSDITSTTEQIDTYNTQIQQLSNQNAVRHAYQQQAAELQQRITQLAAQTSQRTSTVTTLEQLLADVAAQRIGAEFVQQIAELDAQITAIDFDEAVLHRARIELAEFGDIQTQYMLLSNLESTSMIISNTITNLHRDIERTTADITNRQQEHQRIQRQIDSLATMVPADDRALPVAQMQRKADQEVSNIMGLLGRMRERLENAEKAQLRIDENRRKLQTEELQRKRFETLANAFSNRGIQAMLINEYALPALEQEANRLLSRMTDNQLYLSFKTNHLTKQGKTQEVLEIEVSDSAGTRPLEAFSGGEAFRISFALRIALSKLLAHRAGHRLETLIIDEGFGTQDTQGRERLVEAINSISDEFRTILVITHISEVRDMFPTQILIRRTNQTSLWEVIS